MTDWMAVDRQLGLLLDRAGRGPGRVRVEDGGDVATIWLDSPKTRHAMSVGMMIELADAVRALEGWDGGIVRLAPTGLGMFCSGGHLGQVVDHLLDPEGAEAMARAMGAILDALWNLPQLVVAVVPGPAVGGGAELLTATDVRLVASDAWVQFRQAALGVATGWGGARRLVHHVGESLALRWLMQSPRLDHRALAAAGWAEATPWAAADPEGAFRAWRDAVGDLPAGGLRAMKQQLVAIRTGADPVPAFVGSWGSAAHRKALGLPD